MDIVLQNPEKVLQEFEQWIERTTCIGMQPSTSGHGSSSSRFLPFPEVQNYLTYDEVSKLLNALFPHEQIDPEIIRTIYPRIFCILLILKRGRLIIQFYRNKLQDDRLPFSSSDPPAFLRDCSDADFWKIFYKQQWLLLAAELDGYDKHFEKERILPIVTIQDVKVNKEKNTILRTIVLHEAYNPLSNPEYTIRVGRSSQSQNTFVLKTCQIRDAEIYRSEVATYAMSKRLGSSSSLIEYYGSFEQDQTYNILLGWSNGSDLEDYFREAIPPTKEQDIILFWRRLLALIQGVRSLETFRSSPAPRKLHEGRSVESVIIEPRTILISSSEDKSTNRGYFQIADLGRAARQSGTSQFGTIGKTYGCVYSEAATWLIMGYPGLLKYRSLRYAEVEKSTDLRKGDFFHNGVIVSEAVKSQHKLLQESVRYEDYITGNVITRIIHQMLEIAERRPTASKLWRSSLRILDDRQSRLSFAAKRGDNFLVQKILEAGKVEVNSKDSSGCTPLAYAARNGWGDVVDTLLKNGAVPSIPTNGGLTTQELVWERIKDETGRVGKGRFQSPLATDADKFRSILSRLENPPAVEQTVIDPTLIRTNTWPSENSVERDLCAGFSANVRFYNGHLPKAVSVCDLIYSEQAAENLPRPESLWQWLHLPVNNKLWVTHLIEFWHDNKRLPLDFSTVSKFIEDSYDEVRGVGSSVCFRMPVFTEAPNSKEMFSLVVPFFHVETEEYLDYKLSDGADVSLYLKRNNPLLEHFQNMSDLEDIYQELEKEEPIDLHLPRTLDGSYYMALASTYGRDRDQVVYRYTQQLAEKQQEVPNLDYAATRIVDRRSKKAKTHIIMVHQLWLWKIKDMVITAFYEPWPIGPSGSNPTLLDQIVQENINSANDMILHIVSKCVGFLDGPGNGGLIENWLSIFEHSIAVQAQNSTEYYKRFQDACKSPERKNEEVICQQDDEIECLRIVKDIRDELGIINRGLGDQMKAIRDFTRNQKKSWNSPEQKREQTPPVPEKTLQAPQVTSETNSRFDKWDTLLEDMRSRQDRVGKLCEDAKMVEKWINKLLDLKQKQGNLNEAKHTAELAKDTAEQTKLIAEQAKHTAEQTKLIAEQAKHTAEQTKLTAEQTKLTAKLAKAAEDRALASETQSQLLWVFTIVTVFFTPLSFIAAFFAIPSQQFPYNGGGNWKLWQIAVGMSIPEATTILIVLGYWISITKKKVYDKHHQEESL